jgi:hypothetical protein
MRHCWTTDTASDFGRYALYSLPIGKGKAIGSGVNNAVNDVIGEWQTALDVNFRAGFGITPFAGAYTDDFNPLSASSLTGSYQPGPNCVTGVSGSETQTGQIGSSIGKVDLNPGAVIGTTDGAFGNCQPGSLRGPILKTADFNVAKHFPVAERMNLAITAQFINLIKTPIFSVTASWWGQYSSCQSCNGVRSTSYYGPGTETVGLFGLIDGSNPGREIELSMKLNF